MVAECSAVLYHARLAHTLLVHCSDYSCSLFGLDGRVALASLGWVLVAEEGGSSLHLGVAAVGWPCLC